MLLPFFFFNCDCSHVIEINGEFPILTYGSLFQICRLAPPPDDAVMMVHPSASSYSQIERGPVLALLKAPPTLQ